MKLASYNVENLFLRARAMNQSSWAEGRDVLKMHADLNRILGKDAYSATDKKKIVELLKALGLGKSDSGKWAILRQNKGDLVKRKKNGAIEVVANGRGDWIGWLDLQFEAVDETATRMTAQVIRDVNADVLGVVEAENRPALLRFCKDVMPAVEGKPYRHVMLIDGNDERGIDVALMTKPGYRIRSVHSHVDDEADGRLVFSRDCPEFEIRTPKGNTLIVLMNHFKSKGFGKPGESDARRKAQAGRVKEIYEELRQAGQANIAVLGDLNDFPGSEPLTPLLDGTDLKDIGTHANFDGGGFPGTYGGAGAKQKIDYVLLSPALWQKVQRGGIFRKGMWPGVRPVKWEKYPEIEKEVNAASDHGAIWAEIDL